MLESNLKLGIVIGIGTIIGALPFISIVWQIAVGRLG